MDKPIMNLEQRREAFAECTTMAKAMEIVRGKEIGHKTYSFYTSLDRVRQMLTEKTPNVWLTRIDSELFDDMLECKKYGSRAPKTQRKTFIKCFSYGGRESAAMWGLYCPTTYKAIRVTIPEKAMESLLKSQCFKISPKNKLSTEIAAGKEFSDIIYAAVKMNEEETERSNNLYWNGVLSKRIPNLSKGCRCSLAAGRVKDVEWSFENESRLIVTIRNTIKSDLNHIAIGLTPEFINGMRFILSPWANEEEECFVRDCLVKWLRGAGRKSVSSEDANVFRPSTLKGALVQWAKQRGLA